MDRFGFNYFFRIMIREWIGPRTDHTQEAEKKEKYTRIGHVFVPRIFGLRWEGRQLSARSFHRGYRKSDDQRSIVRIKKKPVASLPPDRTNGACDELVHLMQGVTQGYVKSQVNLVIHVLCPRIHKFASFKIKPILKQNKRYKCKYFYSLRLWEYLKLFFFPSYLD